MPKAAAKKTTKKKAAAPKTTKKIIEVNGKKYEKIYDSKGNSKGIKEIA